MSNDRQSTPTGAHRRRLYIPPAVAALTRETTFEDLAATEPTYNGPQPPLLTDFIEAEADRAMPVSHNALLLGVATTSALLVGSGLLVVLGAAAVLSNGVAYSALSGLP